MSSAEVRAGRAYVEVFAKNQALEQGLMDSTRKLAGWSRLAKATVAGAAHTGGAVLGAGLAGAALVGRAVASSMTSVGTALGSSAMTGVSGFSQVAAVLNRLTPLSTRVWDITQNGIGRGTRLMGNFRALLAAAGPAAMPLLSAFDGLATKSASVAWWARAGAALKGDFKGALGYAHALRTAREAYLASGKGGIGAWANIRLGYALTGATSTGLQVGGRLLGTVAGTGWKLASSLKGVATSAVQTAAQVTGLNRVVASADGRMSRFIPRLSGLGSALRGASLRAGLVGGGILGALTTAAGVNGSLSELFSARGFAQHAVEMGDGARKQGLSVETYSSYHAAAKLAGVSLEEAGKDPAKMSQVEAARKSAIGLGAVTTTEQVALAREGVRSTSEMTLAFRAVGAALGTAVLPQLIDGVRWITQTASAVANFIQENPKLIQQLFAIGRSFAAGATIAAALATGLGFLTSPIGIITLAVGGLTAAFPTLWASAKEHFGSITGAIVSMRDGFMEVFGGIVNALSAGNLGLAAEVAWAGLLVAWETGIALADQQWRTWSNALANVIDEGLTEARIKLDAWFPGFEQSFSGTMNFLQDAWTITVNGFLNVWDSAFSALAKSINYLRSLFSRAFDLKGANEAIDKAFEAKVATRTDDQAELLAKRDADRRKRNAALAEKGTEAVLRGELEQRQAERNAAATATSAGSKRLKEAQDRLKLALKEAAAAKARKDETIASRVREGSIATQAAIAKRESRGAAANDIRTREGLTDLLVAFRGGRQNVQQQLLTKATEHVGVAKQGNAIHEKNRRLLDHIDQSVSPFVAKPISGNGK